MRSSLGGVSPGWRVKKRAEWPYPDVIRGRTIEGGLRPQGPGRLQA